MSTERADREITDVIDHLTSKLRLARVGTEEFENLIEAIAKLRSSMNPNIVTTEEILNRR